ncbi:MAG: hypothetical protein ACK5P5_00375 [Pseudobdellovibrionaceae bacterium]
MMMRFLFIFYLQLFSSAAWSAELFEMYRPTRSMGMGGVLTLFPREQDAVILNASFLRWNSGVKLEIINLGIGADKNGYDLHNYTSKGGDFDPVSEYDPWFGKPFWVNGFGKASLSIPYFGFAVFSGLQINAELNNPAFPKFQVNFLNDNISMLGFAVPLGPMSSFGVGLKRILRWGGDQDVSLGIIASGNLDNIMDQFNNRGTGYGVDLSMTTQLDTPFQPTATVVWQDVGSTQFAKTAGSEAPPRIKDNLSFGLGSKLDLPGIDLTAGIEYRHITLQGEQLGKKLHMGAELSLPFVDLRYGVNQGLSTYGAAVDFWFLTLDAATWTEELGEYPGQTPQTRYQATLSLQLGFDANFSLTDSNGGKRKLKQRR